MVIMVGNGGIAAKIKEVIQKLRQLIDRAVEKVINFVADKAWALLGNKKKTAIVFFQIVGSVMKKHINLTTI